MRNKSSGKFRVIYVGGKPSAQMWTEEHLMDWWNRETKIYEKRPVKGHWRTLKPGPLWDKVMADFGSTQELPS